MRHRPIAAYGARSTYSPWEIVTLVAETRPARNPASASSSSSSTSSSSGAPPRRDRRRGRDIHVNDRFAKVTELLEAAQKVWIVWHLVEFPGLPKHVKLIQESDPERVLTVSLSALLDRRLYRRLDPVAAPLGEDRRVVVDATGATGGPAPAGGARELAPGQAGGDNLVPFLRSTRNLADPIDDDRVEAERAQP